VANANDHCRLSTGSGETFGKEIAMTMVWTYVIYLAVSVALTVWVARTLHKNGRVFLIDNFLGNEQLADSVNHLLVVGFYLINIGFVSLFLKYGDKANDTQQAIEYLSTKTGIVLVVLGVMHFFNLLIFSTMRRRALRHQAKNVLEVERAASSGRGNPLDLERVKRGAWRE
jgi:heme/copper-type cytochrome/quinol oxidase subunit 4